MVRHILVPTNHLVDKYTIFRGDKTMYFTFAKPIPFDQHKSAAEAILIQLLLRLH